MNNTISQQQQSYNSNTTLVKVKYRPSLSAIYCIVDSNTTLVKVKLDRTW